MEEMWFVAPLYAPLFNEIAILALFAVSLDLILGYGGILSLGHAAFFGAGAYVAALFAKHVLPDPLVGLAGVERARELTRKPLVAIGGITRQNCRSVIQAGADSVAVISDLIRDPGKSAEEFLRILG